MKKQILPFLFLLSSSAFAIEVNFEQDSNLPLVYVNVAVRGGTIDDPIGQSGISDFLGEMLLRGTKSRSKEQIDLTLDQMGARIEVETTPESLILRGAVLSSQIDPFLKLLTEIVSQPSFPENEIRKLKSETVSKILEELSNDGGLAKRKVYQFLFKNHPYGNSAIGKTDEIKKLTQTQLLTHYNRMFKDHRLLVVGTGDADPSKIKYWADALSLLREGGEEPTLVPPPRNPTHRKILLVDKPDRTQTQIFGGQVGVSMKDPDFFPLYLGNYAFGGGSFSARLMVEIRVKRGWSYGANSNFRHGRQPRSWMFHLFPAAKDTPQALGFTLHMIEELRDKGITEKEFEFSKQSLINSEGFMYNTPQKRVENKLIEKTFDLPEGFMKSYGSNLEKVTLEQTNSALRDFLKPDKLSIVVLCTAKEMKEKLSKAVGVMADDIEVAPYTQE